MNQSSIIVGAILVTFFMYVTIKGELPIYAGLLLLSPSGTTTPQQSAAASGASITANAAVQAGFAAFGL